VADPGGSQPKSPVPWASTEPLGSSYDAVIVGAGIQGLALAYELAKRSFGRIAVLDRGWPGQGASGRNGEMIRSAFGSRPWNSLFHYSLKRWHRLSAELGFNVLFTRAGYLVLASRDDELPALQGHLALHREQGIKSECLSADAVLELVPELNPAVVRGGIYQPDGGFAHHDAAVWGYGRAAARLGVQVHPFTTVTGLPVADGRVRGVDTDRGPIATDTVIDAAGNAAVEVAAMAGVRLPLSVSRLEMIVTESLRPFLRPAVSSPHFLAYCHQTSRGEFVGGTELHTPDLTASGGVTWRMLSDMARKFTTMFPRLAGVQLVRQWSGLVTQSADLAPVLGAVDELEGFYLDCGWVYGFVGAPGAGALLAELIATGRTPPELAPFSLERLRTGRLIEDRSLVVSA
jgi:heterotetrameric sarcosine oxidase beta subunit